MANEKQKEFWSGHGGQNWVTKKETLDDMLSPYGLEAINHLTLDNDSHILDIGCGSGETTFQLANQISSTGSVTGIDISEPLLKLASKDNKFQNVLFVQADAQNSNLRKNFYSHAFSRFGVMFFENSISAFRNIHSSLREDGQLSFICWQSPQKNLWQTLVMMEIKKFIEVPTPNPRDPGPFAFGEKDYVNEILTEANFQNIAIQPYEKDITIFKNYTTENAVKEMLELNPSLHFLKEHPQEVQLKIKEAVTKSYDKRKTSEGFSFPSAAWIVTANKK